jgi:hypothetical protein
MFAEAPRQECPACQHQLSVFSQNQEDSGMSTIYGPQKGHATLYDTLGNDTIIAAGGYNTIYSLYGNDTISGGSIGYNTILAGSQYDQAQRDVTIRVNGLGNTIDGGDANFTIFASTGGTTVSLGNGDNSITFGGQNNNITVGLGRNVIVAGTGNDSVTVVGYPTTATTAAAENVTFAGTGNSFSNDTSDVNPLFPGGVPLAVPTTINGGAGDGTYSLWGGGTVLTGGANNTINAAAGTYNIVAGSGDDTVNLNPGIAYDYPTTATIRLNGTNNVVDGYADNATILGGLGNTTVTIASDTSTYGNYVISLGGFRNTITSFLGQGRIDAGGDDAVVNLADSKFQVFLHGKADFVGLGDFSSGFIDDQSQGLKIDVTGVTNETIDNFGFDRGAMLRIDLTPNYTQPFGTAAQVLAAVHDTAAGAVLNYSTGIGTAGSITFAGVTTSELSVNNFAV